MNQQVVVGRRAAPDERATDNGLASARPGRPYALAGADSRVEAVLRAVEVDIVPRLVLGRARSVPRDVACAGALDEAETARFARILLAHGDDTAASSFVEGLRARGTPIEDIYLRLFQPAARHIGELWTADVCTFVEVTLAVGALQRLLRAFSPGFQGHAQRCDCGRTALLVPLPGDHHTFGLSLVAEFFRRSGWSVSTATFDGHRALARALRETSFTVVGFSLGCADRLDGLAAAIEVVRRESRNAGVGVLVGGPVFVDRPSEVGRVGADGVGLDARQAVVQAERFADRMAGR